MTLYFLKDPQELLDKQTLSLIRTSLAKRIIEELALYFEKKSKFDLSDFSRDLPKELGDGFAAIILNEAGELDEKPEQIDREIGLVTEGLKFLQAKENLDELSKEIKKQEDAGNKKKLKDVKEKFSKMSLKLSSLEHAKEKGIIFEEET